MKSPLENIVGASVRATFAALSSENNFKPILANLLDKNEVRPQQKGKNVQPLVKISVGHPVHSPVRPYRNITLKDKRQAAVVVTAQPNTTELIIQEIIPILKEEMTALINQHIAQYLQQQQITPLSPDYLHMISQAQEFLNENRSADLLHIKCLLRKMFPRDYHDTIELLKEQQDATIIYNINGGNNIIAPKAKRAKQFGSSKTDIKKQ